MNVGTDNLMMCVCGGGGGYMNVVTDDLVEERMKGGLNAWLPANATFTLHSLVVHNNDDNICDGRL